MLTAASTQHSNPLIRRWGIPCGIHQLDDRFSPTDIDVLERVGKCCQPSQPSRTAQAIASCGTHVGVYD